MLSLIVIVISVHHHGHFVIFLKLLVKKIEGIIS